MCNSWNPDRPKTRYEVTLANNGWTAQMFVEAHGIMDARSEAIRQVIASDWVVINVKKEEVMK